jgi:MerR family transcriptional regulator, heat shock protein HspR
MMLNPSGPEELLAISVEGSDAAEYTISIAAQKAEVHEQTLRHYERLGLIAPARRGASAHSPRLYSQRDIARVIYIRKLMRDLGVNLAGVEAILRLHDHIERLVAEHELFVTRMCSTHSHEIQRLRTIIERLQGIGDTP